jgi:hypothetical protein
VLSPSEQKMLDNLGARLGNGVAWHEMRTRTQRIDYEGFSANIRIVRGLRYRAGSVTLHRVTREVLTPIDTGSLSVTSKRLIFDGAHRNVALRHSSLLAVRVFSDGIEVEKASGRSPFFLFSDDTQMIAAIISGGASPRSCAGE